MTTEPSPHNTSVTNRSKITERSEFVEALANLSLMNTSDENFREELSKHVLAPYDIKTPPEKVKKRPDGFDYVESSWMDYESKKNAPLYEYKLLHVTSDMGWITVYISLKDRITGNTELGAGSARIQVNRGVEEPGFRDVIDMGNNHKSALTNAIKNAQSRFGISADIYQRRESVPTDEERKRHDSMKSLIYGISPTRSKMFAEQWTNLGTDWTEFLDRWQIYIDNNKK
jgi:hypothetical protein